MALAPTVWRRWLHVACRSSSPLTASSHIANIAFVIALTTRGVHRWERRSPQTSAPRKLTLILCIYLYEEHFPFHKVLIGTSQKLRIAVVQGSRASRISRCTDLNWRSQDESQ